jgi:PAS domain S-box-containing protein
MELRRWAWAIVTGAVMAAVLVVLAGLFLKRDLPLPQLDLSGESAHIGEHVDFALLFGPVPPIDAATYDRITAQLQNAGGKVPNVGFRHYEGGSIWYRFVVPQLATTETRWNIRLVDYRAITARLIIAEPGGGFRELTWEHDSPLSLAGYGGRAPIFRFDRDEIEGRTVLVGVTNVSALRAEAVVETDRVTDAFELHEAQITNLQMGGLLSVGAFLLIIGIRARSLTLLAASGSFLWFGIFGSAVKGYLRTLLAPWPDLADAILYGGEPWMMSSILLFIAGYLGLPRSIPRLAGLFFLVSALLPLQGIQILLIDLGVPLPVLADFVVTVAIGMILGLGTVIWFAIVRRDRRAWYYLAASLPLSVIGTVRVIAYLGPVEGWVVTLIDSYVDVVLTTLLLGLLAVFELQRRQEALSHIAQLNEQRFRTYAEIASDSYFETDSRGVVLSAAGALVRDLGLVEGMDFAPILAANAAPDQAAIGRRLRRITANPGTERDIEIAIVSPQGKRGWISLNVAPWWTSPSAPPGLRGTISDITERVERREREGRQTTLSALGQLASGVAHEVNNLLHPIINLSRRVRDKSGLDDDSRRLLDLVVTSGQHAGEIVAGVLGAFNPTSLPGSARPIADALADGLVAVRATLPSTIVLSDTIERTSPVSVSQGEMLQVISNLISNAIRAMDGRGSIEVALRVDNAGTTVLSVADTGPGMPESVRRRAIEPFVSGSAGGTGLGLSIVANIVRRWGGDIDIASAPQLGTRIIISIPASRPGKSVES